MPVNLPQQESALRWPLHRAAWKGSTRLIRELLSTGRVVDIDLRDDEGDTALHVASYKDHHHVVEILLQNGADVDLGNDLGFTALCGAAAPGHHRVVRVLLQHGATGSSAGDNGYTALMLAARYGHLVVADMLVKAGAELEVREAEHGGTPLLIAASNGNTSIVRLLSKAGANPDTYAPNGESPLYMAVLNGHAETVKLLLSLGVDLTRAVVQPYGETRVALDAAAEFGHRDVMVMLRDAGAVDTQSVALCTAANNGHEEVVRFLLQQEWAIPGGNYVNKHNSLGVTALCLAVGAASPRIVRMLLDATADETKISRVERRPTEINLGTPLAYTVRILDEKHIRGKPATEDQMHRLAVVRRLLLRVEAVRAASWLWPGKKPFIEKVVASKASPPLVVMVIARRRNGVHRAILASFFRQSQKQ